MSDITLAEKLHKELEDLKKFAFEQDTQLIDMRMEMETLARDLKGVARLIDCMHNIDEFNDKEATISAFNNINRLIIDIASSIEDIVRSDD